MKVLVVTVILCGLVSDIVCPPVKPEKHKDKEGPARSDDMMLGLKYEEYLKEVVNVLEEDEEFKKKLEESNVTDIKSGDIAKHLEFVSHNVRSKLDELKRREVDRLIQLKKLLDHKQNGINGEPFIGKKRLPGLARNIPDISAKVVDAMLKAQGIDDPVDAEGHHLDMRNPDSFQVEDLRKLIVRATEDLEKIDKVRRGEFKKHEMNKEHMRRDKLRQMSERERKEEEAKQVDLKKKHKDHPKVHHPGNKAQLEEVWEESDGMSKEDFNPKVFFRLHDINDDGYLDEEELEALFQRELDKVYDPNNPDEDDLEERYEEMARMREHVEDEVDKDQDGLISLQEFLESTEQEAFDKDPEWDTIDEDDEWTEEELKEYEEELRRQQAEYAHVQPGEINVQDGGDLRFQGEGQHHDNLQGQQGQQVDQMQQQHHQQDQQAQQIAQQQVEAQRIAQQQEEAQRIAQQHAQQQAEAQRLAQEQAAAQQQAQQQAEAQRLAQEQAQQQAAAQQQQQQQAEAQRLAQEQAQLAEAQRLQQGAAAAQQQAQAQQQQHQPPQ